MIYCVSNQKGGVGKSTTAQALAAGLARRGRTVLIIDLDAQGNTSRTFNADPEKPGAFDLLTGTSNLLESIQRTHLDNLFLIAGNQRLQEIEKLLTDTGREYRLKELIAKTKFNDVVIDTPPSICTLTANALTAASIVILPTQATDYSIDAVKYMNKTIATIKQYTNKQLTIGGFLFTRHTAKSRISKDAATALASIAQAMHTKVFAATIPESCKVQQAQHRHTDIFGYAPKDKAATAYNEFIDELLKK